jgi:rhodanese-related sulfurtransferase
MTYRTVNHADAGTLLTRDDIIVLDVRTPGEFTSLGHMPAARLLPVQCIASAPAVVPRGRPILVYCEHGVRSRHAADVLVRTGYDDVSELAHGLSAWTGPRVYDEAPIWGPSAWVLDNADLYGGHPRALDLACGRGRHALLFAAAGFSVTAIDRDADALAALASSAGALGLQVALRTQDLEAIDVDLGNEVFDLIVVTNYLHRPLFPALRRALAPGGLLVYDTFTTPQAALEAGPRNPAFLLEPGELVTLVAPLEIVRSHEGLVDGQHRARVVARRVPDR